MLDGRDLDILAALQADARATYADVARRVGLSPAEVVQRHEATDYRVYMLGFTPGFPYLGWMSPRIAAPRPGRREDYAASTSQ